MSSQSAESHYLHGTSPDEQRRLAKLNELINARSLNEMALQPGDRVLDVGSGLGQLTRAIARQAGAKVVGIERSETQLRECLRFAAEAGESQLVDFRQGEAGRLPLAADEWGTFDRRPCPIRPGACSRPAGCCSRDDSGGSTWRTHHPGGRCPRYLSHLAAIAGLRSPLAKLHPHVRSGRQRSAYSVIVSWICCMKPARSPVRNTWLFFGACAGQDEFPAYVANIVSILEGVRGPILELGEFDEAGIRSGNRRPSQLGPAAKCGPVVRDFVGGRKGREP